MNFSSVIFTLWIQFWLDIVNFDRARRREREQFPEGRKTRKQAKVSIKYHSSVKYQPLRTHTHLHRPIWWDSLTSFFAGRHAAGHWSERNEWSVVTSLAVCTRVYRQEATDIGTKQHMSGMDTTSLMYLIWSYLLLSFSLSAGTQDLSVTKTHTSEVR